MKGLWNKIIIGNKTIGNKRLVEKFVADFGGLTRKNVEFIFWQKAGVLECSELLIITKRTPYRSSFFW